MEQQFSQDPRRGKEGQNGGEGELDHALCFLFHIPWPEVLRRSITTGLLEEKLSELKDLD
jgi:hypothetical protein